MYGAQAYGPAGYPAPAVGYGGGYAACYGTPPAPAGYAAPLVATGYSTATAYAPQGGYPAAGAFPAAGYGPPPVQAAAYAHAQVYDRRDGQGMYGACYSGGSYPSAVPSYGSTYTGGGYGQPPAQGKPCGRGATPASGPEGLIVSGCQHGTVGNIVRGEFSLSSENHGKPVYKKTTQVNGLDVMLYFWDDRDGPNFCGWWFGPKVGGDQVWAYHPEKSAVPPASGWKVPYDGPIDPSFTVAPKQSQDPRRPDEGKKQQESEKRRQQEQRRRQEDEQKRKHMEDQKKQVEDMRKKQEEEQKRKAEELRRAEEELQRKREEDVKRKEEEAKSKRDMEEKRRQEQKSTLAIRRVIQKVRIATPENFDALQKELQDVNAVELENTGTQRQRITEESDKGLEQARARIEQINLARQKEQEKKDEEERKKKEVEDHAKHLVQELTELVDAAEEGTNELKETALPLEDNSELSVGDVERTAQAVEEAGLEAKARTKACTDFIMQKGPEMKDPAPVPTGQLSEIKQALAKLLQRIHECTRTAETAVTTARGKKNTAVRRAAAREKTKEIEALFEKYDKDCDNMLSKKEVAAYAKSEFKFTMPEETLTRIWRNMVEEGQRGVPAEKFPWLRVVIGTARERERDTKRRREREEKESVLTDMKSDLQDKVKEAAKAVDDADKDVSRAEKQVQPLQSKAKTMPAPGMVALADETDEVIKEAKASVAEARKQIDSLSEGIDERFQKDLKAFLGIEVKQLEMRMGRMDSRLSRATNLSSRFREQASRKRGTELEKLRTAALRVIRHNQRVKNLTKGQLFELFDKNGDGEIDEQEFIGFFEDAEKEIDEQEFIGSAEEADKAAAPASPREKPAAEVVDLPPEALSRLFPGFLEEGCVTISQEVFLRVVRLFYKVVKETAMTESKAIKDSKTLRRLELNEVVEVLEGPVREDAAEVMRIRAKAMRDDLEGWATVTGNQGTVFLREGGGLFKVVKETILTETFGLIADKESTRKLKDTTRKVKEGEVLEVYEWPKKEETSGLTRMKAKVKSDGAVGWVTTTGNQGAVFAELI